MRVRTRRLLVAIWFLLVAAFVYRQALAGAVYFGRDAMGFFLPNSTFLHASLQAGEFPLWIPYVRLGQPFAATPSTQLFYPPHLIALALAGPLRVLTVMQVAHALLAAAGAFLCFRASGARRAAAAIGAIAFAFSPLLTDLAGQQNVVDAAAWTGFIVLAVERLRRTGSIRWTAALAAFLALSLLAGSPETTLWQGFLVAVVLLLRRPSRVRPWVLGTTAVLWSVGLAAVLLVPAAEFLLLSARGERVDTLEWSTSWSQVLAMLWPLADHPRGAYWGGPDQWFVLTPFLGTTVVLAAACGASVRRVRALALAGGVLLLLAAGRHSPLTAWLFSGPPLDWFRYPAKVLVGVSFVVALLASRGLSRVSHLVERLPRRGVPAAAVALASAVALAAVGPGVLELLPLREGARSGWIWPVLAAGVFMAVAVGLRARRVRLLALCGCIVVELGLFHLTMMRGAWTQPRLLQTPSELAKHIPDRTAVRISIAGVLGDDPFSSAAVSASAAAAVSASASASASARGVALAGNRFIEERLHAIDGIWAPELRASELFQLSGERAALDLAGVAFHVRRGEPPFPDLQRVAGSEGASLYRSDTALPRAFVVHRSEVVDDATALARALSPEQPARRTAYLAEGPTIDRPPCAAGSHARIVRSTANTLVIDAEACADGILVVSDTYYPGWTATIDGLATPVLRADLALRAVSLPAGAHRVEFRYTPTSVRSGAVITVIAWGLLIAVVLLPAASLRCARRP